MIDIIVVNVTRLNGDAVLLNINIVVEVIDVVLVGVVFGRSIDGLLVLRERWPVVMEFKIWHRLAVVWRKLLARFHFRRRLLNEIIIKSRFEIVFVGAEVRLGDLFLVLSKQDAPQRPFLLRLLHASKNLWKRRNALVI